MALKIACLICGKSFDFLPPHLNRAHGMSADAYRAEFQIRAGQALCSEAYSQRRAEIIRRLQQTGILTYDHLPAALEAGKNAGRGQLIEADRRAQSERARKIPRNQLPPGARRADGRDADHARESQRARRAAQALARMKPDQEPGI